MIRFSVQTQEHTTALAVGALRYLSAAVQREDKKFFGISLVLMRRASFFQELCVYAPGWANGQVSQNTVARKRRFERGALWRSTWTRGLSTFRYLSVLPVPMKEASADSAPRDERAAPEYTYLNEKHSITYWRHAEPVQHESPLTRTHKFSQYPRSGPVCVQFR
jgi:hypothetical protein